jgi:hypothetical protein
MDNDAITLGIRKKQTLTCALFGEQVENTRLKGQLYSLSIKDISEGEEIKPLPELEQKLGFQLNRQMYRDLSGLVHASFTKFNRANQQSVSFKTFFTVLKKGSKKIRKILESSKSEYIPHNIVKFAQNTDSVIGLEISKKLNKSWLAYFFSNEVRTFQFKLINNILGLNYIICHFVPGVDRNCSICDAVMNPDPEDETPLHLFFSCRTVEDLLSDFFDEIGTVISRQEYFAIPVRENFNDNLTLFWVSVLIKKYIWDCKMRKTIPVVDNLKSYVYTEFKTMTTISNFVKKTVERSSLSYIFRSGCLKNF